MANMKEGIGKVDMFPSKYTRQLSALLPARSVVLFVDHEVYKIPQPNDMGRLSIMTALT